MPAAVVCIIVVCVDTAAWHSSCYSTYLVCFFFFYLLSSMAVARVQYSRIELLMFLDYNHNIVNNGSRKFISPEICNPANFPFTKPSLKLHRRLRHRKQKRGKSAGIWAKLNANRCKPAIPCLFLAKSQSFNHKMDELLLRITV